jgi:Precorrin isomerase
MIRKPMDIEKRSMEIIEAELPVVLPEEIKPIVKRVIHTTADFSFAESLHFSEGVVGKMRQMMQDGATVVTDTNMALSGINKAAAGRLGLTVRCFIAEPEIAEEAAKRGETRAAISVERALALEGNVLLVCGNAPTALLRMLEVLDGKIPENLAVIGVPVGFVNVVEAKQALWESGIPCITALGRRGGSNVAASIVNALMYGIEGARA